MSPATVVFLDPSPAPGGASQVLGRILAAVDPVRCRAVVVCRAGTRTEKRHRAAGHPIVPLSLPVLTFAALWRTWPGLLASTARSQVALYRLLRREGAVAIHASGLAAALLAAGPARAAGVPLVWHAHDLLDRRPRNTPFVRLAGLAARAVVCVSEATRDALLAFGVPSARLVVVRNAWFGPEGPPPVVGTPSPQPTVLAVGHVTPLKGQHVLVEAALPLRGRFPGLQVLVAGEPLSEADRAYLDGLRARIAAAGAADTVRFLGFRDDVPTLLASAWVFAHPSTAEETFGLAPLEAMAAGLPVVASRIGGIPEVVEDGVTGTLVEPGQAVPLAEALGTLLSDPALRARVGAAGRAAAAERFAPARMLRELDAVFAGIVEGGILRLPAPRT